MNFRTTKIEISRHQISYSGQTDNLRIVAISDLHLPCYYSSSLDYITAVNKGKPDIFILAGDIIEKRGKEGLVSVFNKVNSNMAKFAVLGNWEYKGHVDIEKLRDEYRKAGIVLLKNETQEAGDIVFAGLDDYLHGSPKYEILNKLEHNQPLTVIISHCPESFDHLRESFHGKMVVIAGHTHGGQVAPFGIVLHTPKGSGAYQSGWYHQADHSLYVMRGIGTSDIPIRIGAKPEILILDIKNTGD